MKSIIIYDQLGEAPIQFFVVLGDYSHLDQIFINSTKSDQSKQDELHDLIYEEDGKDKLKAYKKFPIRTAMKGAKVIVAGFIP